jgi:hypothetical protein
MTLSKPTATTVATTVLCAAKVEGHGSFLWIDGNGKITAANGTLDAPRPNAFSMIQIDDCPGSTPSCRAVCYVHNVAKFAPNTHALYKHNSEQIRRILASPDLAAAWEITFAHWINDNALGGFRWHVSGDIFSMSYARWIEAVCRRTPRVKHWIYTRSFDYLDPIARVATINGGNLTVNLSCDADNYPAAVIASSRQGGLRLCYLTLNGDVPNDLPDESVIFPDYGLRGGTEAGARWFGNLSPQYKSLVCPVDYHGKSEQRRCGPCNRCLK